MWGFPGDICKLKLKKYFWNMEKMTFYFRKSYMQIYSSNLIYIFQADFWNLYSFKPRFKLMFLVPRSNVLTATES